jgi:CRISPR/Cas system-associated exonuclease Cas4 (RecB family)
MRKKPFCWVKLTGMMVRYHLWCKNSLLLLKRKFVESRRHKFLFFILNSGFLHLLD